MVNLFSSAMQKTFGSEKIDLPESESRILESNLITCSNSAAAALSEMISTKVEANPSILKILSIGEVSKIQNIYDIRAVVVSNKIIGASAGAIIVTYPFGDALKLSDILLHKEGGHFKDITGDNVSVIKEFASITAEYYITAINKSLDINYMLANPSLSISPHKVIENIGLGPAANEDVYLLAFEANFYVGEYGLRTKVMVLFKKDDTKKIFEILKKKKY